MKSEEFSAERMEKLRELIREINRTRFFGGDFNQRAEIEGAALFRSTDLGYARESGLACMEHNREFVTGLIYAKTEKISRTGTYSAAMDVIIKEISANLRGSGLRDQITSVMFNDIETDMLFMARIILDGGDELRNDNGEIRIVRQRDKAWKMGYGVIGEGSNGKPLLYLGSIPEDSLNLRMSNI
jgi:hypothetical protein